MISPFCELTTTDDFALSQIVSAFAEKQKEKTNVKDKKTDKNFFKKNHPHINMNG